jgi:hypothetical protein
MSTDQTVLNMLEQSMISYFSLYRIHSPYKPEIELSGRNKIKLDSYTDGIKNTKTGYFIIEYIHNSGTIYQHRLDFQNVINLAITHGFYDIYQFVYGVLLYIPQKITHYLNDTWQDLSKILYLPNYGDKIQIHYNFINPTTNSPNEFFIELTKKV